MTRFLPLLVCVVGCLSAQLASAGQTDVVGSAGSSSPAGFRKNPDVVACLDAGHKPHDSKPKVGNSQLEDSKVGIPVRAQGKMDDLRQAFRNQLKACEAKTPEEKAKTFRFGCQLVKLQDYCITTNKLLLDWASDPQYKTDLLAFMKKVRAEMNVYQLNGKMKLTGYYAPEANELHAFADPKRAPPDAIPVLARPEGLTQIPEDEAGNCGYERGSHDPIKWCLKTGKGYQALPTAEQIFNGALTGKTKVLGWMAPAEFAKLALEGAGEIAFEKDGTVTHVKANYAGQNGQQGNLMKSIVGCLQKVKGGGQPVISEQKKYLNWLGMQYKDAMKYNDNFAFFTLGGDNYLGVDEIPLTENHVIATDPRSIPTGTVSLVETPSSNSSSTLLTTASDIGAAIQGARADVYRGVGKGALKDSYSVDGLGSIYMVLPKNIKGTGGCL